MAKNYATYPCKVMNITQGYTGSYTHSQHNTGSPKDYPWDEACSNSGRDWMFCPCDEMKVVRICGVGNGYTNTLWLESTTVVYFADGTSGYLILLITHPNDDDLKKIKKGDIFKRGEKICREGTDGNATGNHFHFSAGKGKMTGNGWKENSKGKWVLTCSESTAKPEQIFYIDPAFTTIKNAKGLKFKELPKVITAVTSSSTTTSAKKESFLPPRGYFKKGDKGENVKKINDFYYNVFPSYEDTLGRKKENVKGNLFGENTEAWTKEFQRRTGLIEDGCIGPLTLAEMKNYGFKV